MTRALAIPDDGRVVTACCGGHRPASECLCCGECVTNAAVGRMTPGERAAVARETRARVAARRAARLLTDRRAEQLVTCAAIDDCLRPLVEATTNVVHQANAVHEDYPTEQNRFTHMQGVLT